MTKYLICFGLISFLVIGVKSGVADNEIRDTDNGLEFRPLPPDVRSTIIWFDRIKPEKIKPWTDGLNGFLKGYSDNNEKHKETIMACDFKYRSEGDKACHVPLEYFGPCTNATGFGFNRGTPCVFLKFNSIVGWVPSPYNSTDNLPSNMPLDLVEHIKHESYRREFDANFIWVSCEGMYPSDIENIGQILYFPLRGFPTYYFPFLNQPGYMSPLIAVFFEMPKTGVLINVKCQAWARNIQQSEKRGSLQFELMID